MDTRQEYKIYKEPYVRDKKGGYRDQIPTHKYGKNKDTEINDPRTISFLYYYQLDNEGLHFKTQKVSKQERSD